MNRKTLTFAIIGFFLTFVPCTEAQQPNQMRRIGVHMNLGAKDAEAQVYTGAFVDSLQKLGWTVGRNVQIDYRWTEGDPARIRKYAEELVALAPDVILTVGGSQVGPLQQATRTIPIVFVQVTDAVGRGLVESLGVAYDARGNVAVDEHCMTSLEGVFAGGDVKRGASLIVWAIAEGRKMAAGVDRFLRVKSRAVA